MKVGDAVFYHTGPGDGGDPSVSVVSPAIVVGVPDEENAPDVLNLTVFFDGPQVGYRTRVSPASEASAQGVWTDDGELDESHGSAAPSIGAQAVPAVGISPAGAVGGAGPTGKMTYGDSTQAVADQTDADVTPTKALADAGDGSTVSNQNADAVVAEPPLEASTT